MGETQPLQPVPGHDRAATVARVKLLLALGRAHTAAEVAAGRLVLEPAGDGDSREPSRQP